MGYLVWGCRSANIRASVYVPVGAAALAYNILLGTRKRRAVPSKPHNMSNVILGTMLIWFSSFGYNAGSGS